MTDTDKEYISSSLEGALYKAKVADRLLRVEMPSYIGSDLQDAVDNAMLSLQDAVKEFNGGK